jgi:hypothetical protein
MRFAYNPPEMIEDVIDLKCGKLEELEQKQFFDFIAAQVDKVLSAETAFTITLHIMVWQRLKRFRRNTLRTTPVKPECTPASISTTPTRQPTVTVA